MSGTLYIVATPIGNLEDITYRAVKTLKSVDLILAEDTRKTRILLDHYEIPARNAFSIADAGGDKPLISYHQQSSEIKKAEILNNLILGKNIALVTDAGTPGISDPGNELIEYLIQNTVYDIRVIPGPSSITAALSISGLDISKFVFIGFWPKKKAKKTLEAIKTYNCPVIFFDSPFRIQKTLSAIEENLGDVEIVLAQELTKIHERVTRGKVKEVLEVLDREKKELSRIKGEIVCILKL